MLDLQKLKRAEKPREHQIGVRLDAETKQWLEAYCKTENIKSVSSLVAALIAEFIRKTGRK